MIEPEFQFTVEINDRCCVRTAYYGPYIIIESEWYQILETFFNQINLLSQARGHPHNIIARKIIAKWFDNRLY